jgi:cell division protein FtsL
MNKILYLVGILIVLTYIFSLIRIKYFEFIINRLHKEKETRIASESGQGRGIPLSIIQAKKNKISIEYNKKIETLERKRRFILEKLPFIKF